MSEPRGGVFHTSAIVHIAAPLRKVKDYQGADYQLYRAACQRTSRRAILHLTLVAEEREITCRRCLATLGKAR